MMLLPRQHTGLIGDSLRHDSTRPHGIYSLPSPPMSRPGSRPCWLPKPRLPAMPSLLERLSPELQLLIMSELDYQSLIFLSTVNRHFHRLIDPGRMADPADKFQFVMRAAKDFPQHRPSEKGRDHQPGNLECYICFRVRAPEYFDVLQAPTACLDPHGRVVSDREPGPGDRVVSLRRFCIECGVGHGLHAPLDCLTTRAGQFLWICQCRKVLRKPDCLRCSDCGSTCPLRPKRVW
ncbi:uncharacterized protein NECHADRAFT_30241 [Fusarium vanettenii 77-13-4]|uniref:F-box domain-containing protein n=1 Tax=Fusarium vanettenii (strain ATCC MYA-4622 / CBS 123669 / FGSC 9596 / NRRL 45880 / 77-13-4) TaxID=660122 RepID=C7YWN0_FUSV7|nr:uncharacterized protein NECHADRAFT_30241 [Fusarium vanettenii 77-13-4]EEU43987.1 hypothetical protein NECHADRAFT_30241 [Fusarium vanettenii 77-13-4]